MNSRLDHRGTCKGFSDQGHPQGLGFAHVGAATMHRLGCSGSGRAHGFNLIELMIVVAIIAILALIAIPGYQQYILRANRSAAQSLMLDLANREHQYFVANRTYATVAQLGFAMPADLSPYYSAAIGLAAGPPPGFTITFTPVVGSIQAGDGDLTLDGTGNKTPAGKWQR